MLDKADGGQENVGERMDWKSFLGARVAQTEGHRGFIMPIASPFLIRQFQNDWLKVTRMD